MPHPLTLTASDRSKLIRLASTLPAGSDERRAILAGLSREASPDETVLKFQANMEQDRMVRMWCRLPSSSPNTADFKETLKKEAVRQFNTVVLPLLEANGYKVTGKPKQIPPGNSILFPMTDVGRDNLWLKINSALQRV